MMNSHEVEISIAECVEEMVCGPRSPNHFFCLFFSFFCFLFIIF